ncbi:MAG: hypothetical protein AAF702_31320 [Chloroflexota bacterium]
MDRRKLRKAWDTLRLMPMPAIESDRLVDLHNDLTHYDMMIAHEVTEFINGEPVNLRHLVVDTELEDGMRSFRPQAPQEVECRREMLKYKRQIDAVVRELRKLCMDDRNLDAL